MRHIFLSFLCLISCTVFLNAQEHQEHQTQEHSTQASHEEHGHANECGYVHADIFDPGKTAFHHISDQNVYSIGPLQIPLPCFIYVPGKGFDIFSSGQFQADAHGNATMAYNGYVLYEGSVRRIQNQNDFPKGKVELGEHKLYTREKEVDGKTKDIVTLCYGGREWPCDSKSYADGGVLGGGTTSFYDFSITKNVVTMLIVFFLLGWLLIGAAKKYKRREGMAPSGVQGLLETIFVFIQDEVIKPFLGDKWEKYTPFLMSLFFFVLGLNLFGQIPFFGGSNVTGNLSFTLVIAVFAFLVTNLSGNKDYWKHIFWMPGIPGWVKTVVTPVEIMGLFIKPITLTLRLFGNIVAGHMVVVIFVGLIFMFGKNGANPAAGLGAAVGSTLLTIFMMSIELLVAFIQAFVFTILTASYIGAATEEHHHEEAH